MAELIPPANDIMYSDAEKTRVLAYSKLVTGAVAAYAGGDAQTAITTAETAVTNNSLAAVARVVAGIIAGGDKAWTTYEISQDVAAVRDGTKTIEEIAQEKGENYITAALIGTAGKHGIRIIKQGGRWSHDKTDDVQRAVDNRASYTPNPGAVGNMKAFLESPGFGSELGGNSTKTSHRYDGQALYRADKNIGENIKEGELFYLDGAHKNHLEIVDAQGQGKRVINLDGSYNDAKSLEARKRRVNLK